MTTVRIGTGRPAGRAGPAGRAAPGRASWFAGAGAAAWGFARRRPGVGLAVVAVLAGGGLISWNALTQQAGRHPAPLFGPKPAHALAVPPRRPAEIAAAPVPLPRPETPTLMPSPEPSRTAALDPIGSLIRQAGSAAAKPGPASPEPVKVAAAQKALSKLGYGPLKPDGVMGATTRQAVERFERAQNIPVTGGLSPRTARQLASASGISAE